MKNRDEFMQLVAKYYPTSKLMRRVYNEGNYEVYHLTLTNEELGRSLERRISIMCEKHISISRFLHKHTNFLPSDKSIAERWNYYYRGETEPHRCPVCGEVPHLHRLEFCSHECSASTAVDRSSYKKTGPKIDYAELERNWRRKLKQLRPDYKMVEYGIDEKKKRSVFKHNCGRTFDALTDQVMAINPKTGRYKRSCLCENVSSQHTTLDSLRIKFSKLDNTCWIPVAYKEGNKLGKFRHKTCGHVCALPVRYAERLITCKQCGCY